MPMPAPSLSPVSQASVAGRLRDVRSRIEDAAVRAGRRSQDVTLVAVSKTVDLPAILAAREAGQSAFGESKAQELQRKISALPPDPLHPDSRWHFVGRLQRNKVPGLVGVAALIHAVDREDLARSISAVAQRRGLVQPILIQVNVGGDPAKAGCRADDTAALLARVRALPGLACRGLMTIPPLGADPRPVFASLCALRDNLRAQAPELEHLSMGMSGDFEVAIEEGATLVRVGEAIFGPRPPAAAPGSAGATG